MHCIDPSFKINVKANVATFNFNKDFRMDGKVYADTRAKCNCDQTSFTLSINMGNFSVPYCSNCKHPPEKLRIIAYYPDPDSKSGKRKTGDIRHDDQGRRITTPDIAVYMLRQIEKEIDEGIFNPEKYTSQSNREKFKLSYIAKEYVLYSDNRFKAGEITKTTRRKIRGEIKNWITPHFGHLDIHTLDHRVIKKIYSANITSNKRRVLEELNNVLVFAKNELMYNFNFPLLPKKPQRELTNENDMPDIEALYKIAHFADNKTAQKIIKICGLFLIRPSDVVTLKRSDLDLKNGVLSITSHESSSEDISGRKSDNRKKTVVTHTLPIRKELIDILGSNPETYNPNNIKGYLFLNEKGDSFFPYSTLNNVWKRARKLAAKHYNDEKLEHVQLYRAAKHAGVTKLIELGYSDEKIVRITGISREALRHYARLHSSSIADAVTELAGLREIGMFATGAHINENLHTGCTQAQASIATHNFLKKQGL